MTKSVKLLDKTSLKQDVCFNEYSVEVYSSVSEKRINILPYLKYPQDFHGDINVDQIVRFKNTFEDLIGKFEDNLHIWKPNKLAKKNIFILEHHFDEAKQLMDDINRLAQRTITNPKLYDDRNFCLDYYKKAEHGYSLLRKYQNHFGIGKKTGTPVSLERAGLITTRLALGLDKNSKINNEIRVVTKRTHLKGEPDTYLTVTIKWRDIDILEKYVKNKTVELTDFVNPASGASTAAFIIAVINSGNKPTNVIHRSICLTCQGTLFMKTALSKLKIKSVFYSVGECDELNSLYYLTGNRTVGDAGHLLRHFLPDWYRQ